MDDQNLYFEDIKRLIHNNKKKLPLTLDHLTLSRYEELPTTKDAVIEAHSEPTPINIFYKPICKLLVDL